ncbi:MAG: FGGY-family carbohydrate kinase, partial [Pseudomonadota bacterium]|nr:FGGY-family carbohydrate kinase [Pseudomonadota bacterium]
DGGLVKNDWAMQFLSDSLAVPVERPVVTETTALGAAYLAGLQAGLYADTNQISENWSLEKRFDPNMTEPDRAKKYKNWLDAVSRTRTNQ